MIIRVTRHGQPAVNGLQPGVNHEFPPADCPLTELGRKQAAFLGEHLKKLGNCGRIISSPYARTLETADIVAEICGCDFYVDSLIQEGRFYEKPGCPGMKLEEIRSHFHNLADDARLEWPWITPDGVESWAHTRWRIDRFMEHLDLDPEGENILIVGHGASVGALKHYFFEKCGVYIERYNWNCSLSEFELLPDGTWRINYLSEFDFIPEEFVTSNLLVYTSRPVIVMSDLHLGDRRKSGEFEAKQLEDLKNTLLRNQPRLVLNLGDTVSREEFLRDGTDSQKEFQRYIEWRDSLNLPFAECAIEREEGFFAEIFHQEPQSSWQLSDDFMVITLAPYEANDHRFSKEKINYLRETLNNFSGKNVLIGTHVPWEGACSRPAGEGIYLEKEPELMDILENCGKKIYWTGGHFHYPPEPIDMSANPCAFMGGCFAFDDSKKSYLRKIVFDKDIEITDLFL